MGIGVRPCPEGEDIVLGLMPARAAAMVAGANAGAGAGATAAAATAAAAAAATAAAAAAAAATLLLAGLQRAGHAIAVDALVVGRCRLPLL